MTPPTSRSDEKVHVPPASGASEGVSGRSPGEDMPVAAGSQPGRRRTPERDRSPDRSPEQAPEKARNRAPAQTPERTRDQTPERTRDQTPDQTREHAPDQSRDQERERAQGQARGQAQAQGQTLGQAQSASPPVSPLPVPLPLSLSLFNSAPHEVASALLLRCCGSTSWAARIADFRPYPDTESLLAALDEASYDMTPEDVAEALASESPLLPAPWEREPDAATAAPGARRPAHDRTQDRDRTHDPDRDRRQVLAAHTALRAAHAAYENRFGHTFLVCLDGWAPGEQLGQALAAVRARLGNDPDEERPIVADELRRVARGRLLRALR
jgi:2-oxo-4-hydroxy-4-carboxy-5-ureidoimidazoline decarboxylase